MLGILNPPIQAIRDFWPLTGGALRNVVLKPCYMDVVFLQMNTFGVGSLAIVVLTGFFGGTVMTLQMGGALAEYGGTQTSS